ncbi:DJ-1/PfpI family protein [Azospirillum sp. RWY-5-1]|uniref:DJ-1/PfpI family protein n=1 Tax=Azospirillum oleiclasticum TaxID=2735135 RepID=A0ABX2TL89_9PROT|nr:DJ-1/PfpI family protein [Azospirillum oleiclasticum]NYZ17952.1 DJ-1/PfpI family protein [Azospirillum oleiclasticum]NYZ25136.1 DJ-1/PfpI family protein [Azospirillum oleiclasticum]
MTEPQSSTPPVTLRAGLLLFPRLTQLDLTGPYEVLARVPGARVDLLWKTLEPVAADTGLRLLPTTTFDDCPELDLLLVPGGAGVNDLMTDAETLAFLSRTAARTRWLAGVCTGSLVLGAAGLLRGRRAGSHWSSRHFLAAFGATPVEERVVVDGHVFTGGGVTAGIDVVLRIVAELCGETTAKAVQLSIEYDPEPPFDAGTPSAAGPEITGFVRARSAPMLEARARAVDVASRALAEGEGTRACEAPRSGHLRA